MRGLIATEWLERTGGAERVVDQLLVAFPDSDLCALWNDAPERFPANTRESWLARTPLRGRKALSLPLMPPTWRGLRTAKNYDWLLASAYVFAHHARPRGADIPRLAYMHSPARFLWSPEFDPRGASPMVRAAAPALKAIDRARANELTAIAANSAFVAKRIEASWDRESTVIHPPVDVDRLLSRADWRAELGPDELAIFESLPEDYVLGASRFVAYKRLDLVIDAAELAGLPVVIAGRGPEEAALRERARRARIPVHFVISPSDALLFALHQHASVFVFPAIEDFGIIPVEAQALGTPVVTGPIGGQIEALEPGTSGVLADSQDAADLARALDAARRLAPFDGEEQTKRFRNEVFVAAIQGFVDRALR